MLLANARSSSFSNSNGNLPVVSADSLASAKIASLQYVSDAMPGIRRIRKGKGFVYLDTDGKVIRDPVKRRRIKSLAIPPAWTDVWICSREDGHLQATGRDAKGRKQHRYHQRWREVRDENKFDRVVAFAETLPTIRKRIAQDLGLPGITEKKCSQPWFGFWKPRLYG